MKITVCGSISFAERLVEVYKKLKEQGHEPLMHEYMFRLADGTAPQLEDSRNRVESSEIKRKYDFIRAWYRMIVDSDAVLICNFDKNGIRNYVGGNSLMEMGFAHVNNKKVFLLNPIPDVPYRDEIKAMADKVINGDLRRIS
jgi:hypothetical protein